MTTSGASRDYINLLPDPVGDGAWTTYLPTVEDIGDDPIFEFDGESTAVEIPRSVVDPDALGTSFTISTWMKHGRDGSEGKQQIVCAADGEGMIDYISLTMSTFHHIWQRTPCSEKVFILFVNIASQLQAPFSYNFQLPLLSNQSTSR